MAQFKTVRLPFTIGDEYINKYKGTIYSPLNDSETQKAEAEIQELITEGWKIVSTSELLGTLYIYNNISGAQDEFYSVTIGILVFMVKE